MDCDEIRQPVVLVNYFRKEDEATVSRVLRCFFKLYFESFQRLTYTFCLNYPHTKNKEEGLARDAFNQGLLSFFFFIREKGFEDRGASVKSLFITFCLNKLKGLVKEAGRQSEKQTTVEPNLITGKVTVDDYQASIEESARRDKEEKILSEAFKILGERCTNLILWRKFGKMSDSDIAQRLNIQSGSVNNEVFKCFKRLKQIVEELKKGKKL